MKKKKDKNNGREKKTKKWKRACEARRGKGEGKVCVRDTWIEVIKARCPCVVMSIRFVVSSRQVDNWRGQVR